jgi:hypothetical protein
MGLMYSSSDIREAPVVQEIITYLGSFIRSSGSILDGIMRVRTHFFIIAMREEIIRMKSCDEEEAIELLMELSPYEMKSLLGQVLSAADHTRMNQISTYTTVGRWKQIYEQNGGSGGTCSLKVTAQSGGLHDGNFCRIEVERDGVLQDIPLSFSPGLNVVVLDCLDGNVVETAVFEGRVEGFTRFVEGLEGGCIFVGMGMGDCSVMSESAKGLFEQLGSIHVRELVYHASYILETKRLVLYNRGKGVRQCNRIT